MRNIPPTEILTFRPTAISDLRQLLIFVLFEEQTISESSAAASSPSAAVTPCASRSDM